MPTYQYECDDCQHQFEAWQSMMDKKLKKCPACGKMALQRLIGTGGGIIFKGSGFYETDYKNKKATPASCSGGSCCGGTHAQGKPACPVAESSGGCGGASS